MASSGTAFAQWYRTYDDGLRALKGREWLTAIAKFEAAKAEADKDRRRPGRSVLRYGNLREPFIPDFFLGQAYIGLAQDEKAAPATKEKYYREALKAFDLATNAQVRKGDPEFPQLEAGQRVALAGVGPVVASVEKPVIANPSTEPLKPRPETVTASARQELQKLIDSGDGALASGSWDAAASAFAEGARKLAENPSLRPEFAQVQAREAEASFARDVTLARQALADGRFPNASEALDRFVRQSGGIAPSSAAVRALISDLPKYLNEAQAGQALTEADTAYRERRWSVAASAYEAAARLAQGITFSSARGKELSAQIPARLQDARLKDALAAKRYVDALAIDPSNTIALEGQYSLALDAYNHAQWEEARAAFDALLKYAKSYRDVRDRATAAAMQVELGLAATADPINVAEARQRYERVLALQHEILGSLAETSTVVRAADQASNRLQQIDGRQGLESARKLYQNGEWDEAQKAVNLVSRVLRDDKEVLALQALLNDAERGERIKALTTQAKDALVRGDVTEAGAAAEALKALLPDNETAAEVLAQVTVIRTARWRRQLWFGATVGLALIGPILLVSPRRRGRFLAAVGRPAAALQLYERVLSTHPTDGDTLSRAAELSVRHGTSGSLATHFNAYLRARPDDAVLAATAADFFWSHGERDRALALYERLLLDGVSVLPPAAFARVEERYPRELPDAVVEGLQRLRRANTGNRGPVRLLARHYATVDRSDTEALEVYRTACQDDPADGRIRMSYAKALDATRAFDAAATEAAEAARLLPGDETILDFLADEYSQSAGNGSEALASAVNALPLPAESRLVVCEALFARNPSLRGSIRLAYESEDKRTTDPAVRCVLQAHQHLDTGDSDAARVALDAGFDAPRKSAIVLRCQLDAYQRYLAAETARGRTPDAGLVARVAELYAEGHWWNASVNAWQRIVSTPEWNRRSMAAIEAILDRLSIAEAVQTYFTTAGWTATKAATDFATCAVTPGASANPEFRAQFDRTPVFCFSSVVTVDDAVRLKREVLAAQKSAQSAVAFLVATQPIRHDVYALIYAFMTEEPSVTVVPIEARVIREAIVEARGHVHLERTLHQWLGHTDIFETHNPVSNAATFFGRGQFINQLVLKITRGQNFGIFGVRKIGKTSLVYRMRELSRDHLVAYVDLQGVASRRADEVYLRLLESLVRDLRVKHPDVKVPALNLNAETPSGEVATSFHADVTAIRNAFESTAKPLPHVLLLLDEIELMVPHGEVPGFAGHQDFFRHIRGLYQQERFIVSAVVGATPSVCRMATWNGRDNPVFQFYDEVFLAPLDRQECDQMVQGLGELMGVRFDQSSLRMIFEQTAGHPYVARQLCSRLVKSFPERPLEVRSEMMVTAIADYLAQRGDYFAGIVEGYLDDLARRIVETIAMADESGECRAEILQRIGGLAERHVADQVLGDLELVGLVSRDGDRYKLSMPLLRRWLRRSWLDVE